VNVRGSREWVVMVTLTLSSKPAIPLPHGHTGSWGSCGGLYYKTPPGCRSLYQIRCIASILSSFIVLKGVKEEQPRLPYLACYFGKYFLYLGHDDPLGLNGDSSTVVPYSRHA